MRKKGGIARSFMMISQISISMLVPIFLCLFFGIKLNEWLDAKLFVPLFLFLGMGAAVRNVYHLTKGFYAKDKKREERGRDRALSWEGSLKKRDVSKHQETLSLLSLWRALEAQRAT